MASEDEKVRRSTKKKSREEEEEVLVHEILRGTLGKIQSDIQRIDKAIDFNEDNPRKLSILLNTKARYHQQLFYCIALMRDPKLRLTSESGRMKDFARMIEGALLEENPASAKLVEEAEAEQKTGASSQAPARAPDSSEKDGGGT